jgi:outer membrane protein assembly factor BamB
MNERLITSITAAVTGLLGSALVGLWFFQAPVPNLTTREPGADGRKDSQENPGNKSEVKIGQYFQKYSGAAAPSSGSWPAFRGKDRDDIDRMNKGLSETWPESGPPILWSIDLGEGHAGPAVNNGKVYLLDYDEARKSDSLRCLSLADGKEIWRRWYTVPMKRNHGLSRTVPAVTDKYAVTI